MFLVSVSVSTPVSCRCCTFTVSVISEFSVPLSSSTSSSPSSSSFSNIPSSSSVSSSSSSRLASYEVVS